MTRTEAATIVVEAARTFIAAYEEAGASPLLAIKLRDALAAYDAAIDSEETDEPNNCR